MTQTNHRFSRRGLLKGAAAAAAAFTIVPRHVLGQGLTPPSETFGGALIGCGGRGGGTWQELSCGPSKGKDNPAANLNVVKLADCDVRFKDRADNKKIYSDFRKLLERKDIDLVAIATPPHWHALISIAAAEAGKDVLSEKPMTRTIAEGRAVVEAFKRYGRIFSVGTFGRFGTSTNKGNILIHKIMRSGLYKDKCPAVHVMNGGVKVKEWSGKINLEPRPVPANLDWDLYCGPSQIKPFQPPRHGGTHRWYWDYEGGGLCDMGQHHFDPIIWLYGKDDTAPVEVEPYAPVAHPECSEMWGWVKLRYADGFQIVMESREWGPCPKCGDSVMQYPEKPAPTVTDQKPGIVYEKDKPKEKYVWRCRGCGEIAKDVPSSGAQNRQAHLEDLSPEDQAKIKAMPDPEPLRNFAEAVKSRKPSGGTMPEAAHRTVTVIHLANLAIRLGRKINFDPVAEQIVGDEEANRMVNQPLRAPWHI